MEDIGIPSIQEAMREEAEMPFFFQLFGPTEPEVPAAGKVSFHLPDLAHTFSPRET